MKSILAVTIISLFALSFFYNKKYSSSHARNFLNYKSTNLSTHLISHHSTNRKKALLLGSSSVAGNNIHKNSTLADYLNLNQEDYFFYNLGSLEGTLIDSLVFLDQAISLTKIDMVMVGLSPDMFYFNSSGIVPIANLKKLQAILPADEVQKIENEKKRKLYFEPVIDFISEETIPFKFVLEAKARMNNLASVIYGNYYAAHVSPEKKQKLNFIYDENWLRNLKVMVDYCRKKNIAMVFYLEPNLNANQYYSNVELENYVKGLQTFFAENKLQSFNLLYSLEYNADYFIDYQHLTPKGYELLALNLKNKIKGFKL